MKDRLRVILRLVFGIALLVFVLSRAHLSQLSVKADARFALAAAVTIALLFVAQGGSALRWTRILGDASPGWLYMWRLYAVGAFFSLFLPTVVGGDAVRAVALSRQQSKTGAVVASVLLDRGFGVLALVLYLIVGAVVAPELLAPVRAAAHWKLTPLKVLLLAVAGIAFVAVFAIMVRRSQKIRGLWRDGLELCLDLVRRPLDLAGAIMLGMLVQAAYIGAWVVLAEGLRFTLPFTLFLVAVPLVSLATMLPITFAGIGVREGAWVLLMSGMGVANADIVAFSLLYFACVLVVGACGGLVFMLRGTELHAPGAPPAARAA